MSTKESIKKELKELSAEGQRIFTWLDESDSNRKLPFGKMYQAWYTKALKAMEFLAPDRTPEFRSYYEADSRRKTFAIDTYSVQDFIKGFEQTGPGSFDAKTLVLLRIMNQLHILESVESRIDSVLANVEAMLLAGFIDEELATARQVAKVNPRAAGALAGVILEGHLQRTAKKHNVKISKANPTIGDLNDPLKTASVYDLIAWRKISYLADIRNICSHQKNVEPTKQQVEDLLDGVNWALKNIG